MLIDYILEKLTEDSYPNMLQERCLLNCSSMDPCTKCRDICPKDAMLLNSGKISMDENLCIGCGLCKAVCPTQAIQMKKLGEESILRVADGQEDMVFSCSIKGGAGATKLTCLHAFHPELLAILFLMQKDKMYQFNLSSCKNCSIAKHNNLLFYESLTKADNFVSSLGLHPKYEVITNENSLNHLTGKTMSRRDLFSIFRKESTNIATQAMDTIISEKESYLPIRKILLHKISSIADIQKENTIPTGSLLSTWRINEQCNGCGQCQSACSNKAWSLEKEDGTLKLYHHAGKCYQCRKCIESCSKKAIEGDDLRSGDINRYHLKKQISLTECSLCHKDFVAAQGEKECPICNKKEALRKKLASN